MIKSIKRKSLKEAISDLLRKMALLNCVTFCDHLKGNTPEPDPERDQTFARMAYGNGSGVRAQRWYAEECPEGRPLNSGLRRP